MPSSSALEPDVIALSSTFSYKFVRSDCLLFNKIIWNFSGFMIILLNLNWSMTFLHAISSLETKTGTD